MDIGIGPLYVRRSILIEAPASRVWKELETSERIKQWLNLGHELHTFEPLLGGQVEIFHHGFERFGSDAADNLQGYEEGWDIKHLSALRALVDA